MRAEVVVVSSPLRPAAQEEQGAAVPEHSLARRVTEPMALAVAVVGKAATAPARVVQAATASSSSGIRYEHLRGTHRGRDGDAGHRR